jgi:hypothetical protein
MLQLIAMPDYANVCRRGCALAAAFDSTIISTSTLSN